MNPPSLAEKLTALLDEAIQEKVFPGAVAGISFGSPKRREKILLARGTLHANHYQPERASTTAATNKNKMDKEVVFDLASLTKPLATLLSILCLIQSKKIQLSDRLANVLQTDISSPLAEITIAQLLGHCSGLAAHRPYYEKLRDLSPERRAKSLHTWLLQEKQIYAPGSKTIYSDLGYIFLSWIVEQQTACQFDKYVKNQIMAPLGLENHLFFNKPLSTQKVIYAPTEKCLWRQKTLAGEVHDDNCYTLGGVSGHAGLFGDIHGVLTLALHLLDVWKGRSEHPNYTSASLKKMTTRQNIPETTWALGFDTPSPSGSSAGKNMSSRSFGHLGFTGTSFWIDPEVDLVMVLLSNRVHPSRENELIRTFRPHFHNTIMDWLNMQK